MLAGRENKTLVDIFNAILLVCHVMDVVGMMSCKSVQCSLSGLEDNEIESVTIHNLMHGQRTLYMIKLLLCTTKQQLCLKTTLHPASQSFTTEIRACVLSKCRILPSLALRGSIGQSISHSSVDLHFFRSE